MFYFIFVIIVLLLFIIMRKDKRGADKYLIGALFFFMLDILSMIIYVSKDVYYYNVLNHYFWFPSEVWNVLMYSKIPQDIMIRMMNLCSTMFIYLNVQFAFTFMSDMHLYKNKKLRYGLITWLGIQIIFYDPFIYRHLYLSICGNLLSAAQIIEIVHYIEIGTQTINMTIIGTCAFLVFIANLRVNKSHFFRGYALGESVCYLCVAAAYALTFWFSPSVLIQVSKLAGYISYMQVPLTSNNVLLYRYFPYYMTLAGSAIFYIIIRYIRLQKKLDRNELEIKRQVDAAVVTSRAFCHFMKNEVLSIQAEIELFEVEEQNQAQKKQIIEECEYLYARLDELHHSTKLSELTLRQSDIREIVKKILEHMTMQLQKCIVNVECKQELPYVMLDHTYFEQAVNNVISNSVDAMYGERREDNILSIRIEAIDKWVQLSISDNGRGISQEDLERIFSPFVTSQPIKKHWGIGLTLTYKIIEAHGGKIEVDSMEKKGTTFKILLPSINTFE